jgi:hypothetical protein
MDEMKELTRRRVGLLGGDEEEDKDFFANVDWFRTCCSILSRLFHAASGGISNHHLYYYNYNNQLQGVSGILEHPVQRGIELCVTQ